MKTRARLINLTAVSDVTVLRSENERLNAEAATLQTDLDKAKGQPFLFCSNTEVTEMKAQGLDDPIADVMTSAA